MAHNGGSKMVGDAVEREPHARSTTFRMRQIVQLLAEGVLLLDRRGRIIELNSKASELLGISADILVGDELERLFLGAQRSDGRLFLAEDLPGRRALLSGVPQTGVTMGFERRTGPTLWLEVDAIPLGSIEEEGAVVLVSFRDISEHRRADEAVRFQAGLLDAVAEAIVATDRQLRITYCNAGTESLLQRSRAETLGESTSAFIAPHRRDDIERIEHLLVSGLTIRDFETVVRRADGTDVEVSMSVTCQTNSAGQPNGAIAIIRDISERVRSTRDAAANAERSAAAERHAAAATFARAGAQRANEAEAERLARLSHSMRTPLNSVLGFAQLLEDAELADPVDRRSVAQILQAGRRLLALVDEVVDDTDAIDALRHGGGAEPVIELDRPTSTGGDGLPVRPRRQPGARPDDRELTILYVDDDPAHLRAVEAVVAARGHVDLVTTTGGRRGIELAHALRPDLLLLSAGLADVATSDALAQLRADGTLEATCVMVVNALAPGESPERRTGTRGTDAAHAVDLGRLLRVVDGLATTRFARASA